MARQRVPGCRTHWLGLSDRAWGVPHPRDGLPPGLQRRHWAPTPSAELWPMGGTLPGLPMAARLRALVTSADCALCGSERELESRGEPEMPMKTRPAVQPMNVFLGGFFRTRPRSLVHPSAFVPAITARQAVVSAHCVPGSVLVGLNRRRWLPAQGETGRELGRVLTGSTAGEILVAFSENAERQERPRRRGRRLTKKGSLHPGLRTARTPGAGPGARWAQASGQLLRGPHSQRETL